MKVCEEPPHSRAAQKRPLAQLQRMYAPSGFCHSKTDTTKYFGAIQRDITEKRTAFEDLERLAHQDILTGIGNRAALEQHMEHISDNPDITADKLCMLLFDMDGFKQINDTLGHIARDNVLRHFVENVATILGPDDFLARLGDDEFVAILRDYSSEAALLFAKQAVSSLAAMKHWGADEISVSVGMTFFLSGDKFDAVINRADTALYRAKNAGKGIVRVCRRASDKKPSRSTRWSILSDGPRS